MTTATAELVGSWRRLGAPPCAAQYPALLHLEADGRYRGSTDPPGGFARWDVGTWELVEQGRVAISTANDAVIRYDYALDGDALVFTDPEHCRFGYRREG